MELGFERGLIKEVGIKDALLYAVKNLYEEKLSIFVNNFDNRTLQKQGIIDDIIKTVDIKMPKQLEIENNLIKIELEEFRKKILIVQNDILFKALDKFVLICSEDDKNAGRFSKLEVFLETLPLDKKLKMTDIDSLIKYVVLIYQNRISSADCPLASSVQVILKILLKKIEEGEVKCSLESKTNLIDTLLTIDMEGLKYAWMGFNEDVSKSLNSEEDAERRSDDINELRERLYKTKYSLSQLEYTENKTEKYESLIEHFKELFKPHEEWDASYEPKKTIIETYMIALEKLKASKNFSDLSTMASLCYDANIVLTNEEDNKKLLGYIDKLKKYEEDLDKIKNNLSKPEESMNRKKEKNCELLIERFRVLFEPYKKWTDSCNLKKRTTITKTMRVLKKFKTPKNFNDLSTMIGLCYGVSTALDDKTKNKRQRLRHIRKLKKYVEKTNNSLSQLVGCTKDQKKVCKSLIKHLEVSLKPHEKWADSYKPGQTIIETYMIALEKLNKASKNFSDLSTMIGLCYGANTVVDNEKNKKDKKKQEYAQSVGKLEKYVKKTENSLSQLNCTKDQREVCKLSIKHFKKLLKPNKDWAVKYNKLNKESKKVKKPSSSPSRLFAYIIKSLKLERCISIR